MKKFLTAVALLVVLGFAVPTQVAANDYIPIGETQYQLCPPWTACSDPRPPVPPAGPGPGNLVPPTCDARGC